MSDIVLLDTSVYLNVLDVPGFNQKREEVLSTFALRVDQNDYFLLPMATIWETGNHIAKLPSGGRRYQYAQKLVDAVASAINGDAPYRPTHFPTNQQFLAWLAAFPQSARQNKSITKTNEGVSLSDHAIIKEWEQTRSLHAMSRVLIWSLDSDLSAYDYQPG